MVKCGISAAPKRALDCDHFWECASKNVTVTLVQVHGLPDPKRLLHTARAAELRHIVAGVRFHWSREERCFQRERFSRAWFTPVSHRTQAAQKRRVCRAGAVRAHCAFTRCVSTNTKVHAVDGAQRRIWFWKARYLCCLPHITLWRLSLFF